MLIANPIYDTFFKYLFEDNALAIKLLSAILNEKIVSLDPRPQEQTLYLPNQFLTVIRMDFAATIRTKNGTIKKVLIELQKSKASYDIMRFRRYLAENYSRDDAMFVAEGEAPRVVLPIVTVYFLGFGIKGVDAPVIKVNRQYTDVFKGKKLKGKIDFIEKLTHDCFVIIIPLLKVGLRTPLEKILGLFNQEFVKIGNEQVLVLPEGWENDPELHDFIQRLGKPLLSEDLLRKAEAEEQFESQFAKMERKLEQAKEELADVGGLAAKAKIMAEKAESKAAKAESKATKAESKAEKAESKAEKAESKAEKAESKAEKAESKAEKAESKAEKAEKEKEAILKKSVTALRQHGKTTAQVAELLEIPTEIVEKLSK